MVSSSRTNDNNHEDPIISKNWVWVPNQQDLFTKGYITDYLPNGKCKVNVVKGQEASHDSTIVVDQDKLENCNPVKFNKCEDMAELTHLNEPSVVYNLYLRYLDDLIYTYSGLFLVAINPYKSLPIYNQSILMKYHQYNNVTTNNNDYKSKNSQNLTSTNNTSNNNNKGQSPPHIFAVAESTFRNLLSNKKDQSILVTGESGAGKTENTKKIIQYLSSITSSNHGNKVDNNNIDTKILQANPILESFGNAKTIKNNNSSRFGKFIQIYFSNTGEISGANINYYLLEKSRVISQSNHERNYHIFYQFLKGYENLPSLGLNKDMSTYNYLSGGKLTINNVDDFKEFNLLVEAFKIMGLTINEMNFIYQVLAIILHLGNINFTSWKSEQANFTNDSPIDKICELLAIDKDLFVQNLLRPKVKAGREFITKSKKPNEVKFAIDAFAKYLYEKLFQFIITKINEKLDQSNTGNDNSNKNNDNNFFIGVLDIAGFEIFEINSFEQLCINYTNEKLQQFFNHHSFILEQSEYLRENINWEFIDFGQDLQPTIDLIETKQPMGILKLLDEECLMPKSSDASFMEKLSKNFSNTHKKFSENKFKNGFIIHHYAGKVEYNVENWLQKNTDPISESILNLLPDSQNELVAEMFINDPHINRPQTNGGGNSKLITASQKHKDQLKTLMDQLESTEPHFVRCILPNLEKRANKFDKNLVLGQLRCNGVLEGIRITRAGYPNRMMFDEFIQRYSIICDNELSSSQARTNCEIILKYVKLNPEDFKVGLTKIFFKNGILGKLEIIRDLALKNIFTDLQKVIRGNLTRLILKQKIKEIQSAQIISRTMVTLDEIKSNSPWMTLFFHVKPLLEDSVKVLDSKKLQENLQTLTVKLKDSEKLTKGLEMDNEKLREQMNTLQDEMINITSIAKEKDDKLSQLRLTENKSKHRIETLEIKLKDFEKQNQDLINEHEKLTRRSLELHDKHNEKVEELNSLNKLHDAAQSELSNLKQQLKEITKLKQDHSKELLKFKQMHDKSIEDSNEKMQRLESLNKKLKADLNSSKDEISNEHGKLQNEIIKLKELCSDYERKQKDSQRTIDSLQIQLKKDEDYKSKYDLKIEEAKEKVTLLKGKVEKKSQEIDQYKSEIKNLKTELASSNSKITQLDKSTKELAVLKSKESKYIEEMESTKQQLSKKIEEYSSIETDYNRLQIELKQMKQTNTEYGTRIAELNSQLSQVTEEAKSKEIEKENQPPNPQFMEEFTHMKLKVNEQTASLRKEKFENKKLSEELQMLKERIMNGSLTSMDLTPKRRSLAIGDKSMITNTVDSFNKEIENLKFQLQQEQGNFQRAENYAIELQKKLNKLLTTRGLNTNTDYEKKFYESQKRITQLESKIGKLLANSGGDYDDTDIDGNDDDWELRSSTGVGGGGGGGGSTSSSARNSLVKSESITAFHNMRGVSQDYIQIYQDITKTLKSTREELNASKTEILRLKALLRESEDELYQVKQENYKASVHDYEQDLAQLKVKHETLLSRNKDINESLEIYKKRSDEYYKKLELAESAIVISKRHEEQATKEMKESKSQLLLVREELRTSSILIKDFRIKVGNLEATIEEKNHQLDSNKEELKQLQDKLNYHLKNFENKELNEKLKEEIKNLNRDLDFKTDIETKLIKENKKLQLDYEDILLVKNNLQNEVEELILQEEKLQNKIDELTNTNRQLENEKLINERKIVNCTKQISGLKELVDEISIERDKLLKDKDILQNDLQNMTTKFDSTTTELKQAHGELDFLKKHLEIQREDSEAIKTELNQSKMSTSFDIRDQQKLRNELLVTKEENFSLSKTNKELNLKVSDLEDKLYSNEQLKYWESKVDTLSKALDGALNEKHESDKIIKDLQRTIKQLEIRVENESQLSKRYNDENFDYQNKINHYKSTIDIIHNENIEKDLQLKSIQRENIEMKESMLMLQKEVLELRERLQV
ncbi:type II myosin heavy chain, putative [Candida dubliniensis CD36]|uniref:Type II myosin heavy chain, putative n=1 Tax=Candida dubliniensis (strain CD36 / ATCC MYA-646 / CBS 7987 / NCPF 3949 / NRRL Y-17841) TaxID=573826 RepID=B9WHA6_CANDC|nr:type II myosin heavy chain, putative [Candida dubliniensis CD36]CAX41548.1 type II myosin heavy chain, putative [Candida dubliniensis CD36]